MSILTNFQVSYQSIPSANYCGRILIEGLELPDTSTGFSLLAKIWKSSCKFVASNHYIEVFDVFREKKTERGYECIFSLKNAPTKLSDNTNHEDFLREQIWQFGRILRIFLSSESFVEYCEYLASNDNPNPLTCNHMLDDFLEGAGVIA